MVGFQIPTVAKKCVLQLVTEIGPFEIQKHSKPNFLKVRFQMVFGKMAAICQDFKRLSFQISDPIRTQIQWGLKYPTHSDFGWSRVVQMLNGLVLECHSKSTHWTVRKRTNMGADLNSYVLVQFSNGRSSK